MVSRHEIGTLIAHHFTFASQFHVYLWSLVGAVKLHECSLAALPVTRLGRCGCAGLCRPHLPSHLLDPSPSSPQLNTLQPVALVDVWHRFLCVKLNALQCAPSAVCCFGEAFFFAKYHTITLSQESVILSSKIKTYHHRRSWVIFRGGPTIPSCQNSSPSFQIFSCQGEAKFADSVLPC